MRLILALLAVWAALLPGWAFAQLGSVRLVWTPPTENTDGTPLTDLAGYRIFWGTSPTSFPSSVFVNSPSITTYLVDDLPAGAYYFRMTAINVKTTESDPTNVASAVVGPVIVPPADPTVAPTVTWEEAAGPNGSVMLTWTWRYEPNAEFALKISNESTVVLESVTLALASNRFDWVRGTTFVPANLSANGDGIFSTNVTFTAPIQPGESIDVIGDVDTAAPSGIAATIRLEGMPAVTLPMARGSIGFAVTHSLQ